MDVKSASVVPLPKKRERNRCYFFQIQAKQNVPMELLDPRQWPECTFMVYHKLCRVQAVARGGKYLTEMYRGYMEFSKQLPPETIAKWPGFYQSTYQLNVRECTQAEAIQWGTESDTKLQGPWRYGLPKEQGKRRELLEIQRKLRDDVPLIQRKPENQPKRPESPKVAKRPRDDDPLYVESEVSEPEVSEPGEHKRNLWKYSTQKADELEVIVDGALSELCEQHAITPYWKKRVLKRLIQKI